jgi:three-Cys-motif partner protein
MSKEHRDEHFSEFRGHTLLKHSVLDRYVKAWIQILKLRHETLWILDGFAGKGQDDLGNPGSPLLLARSAAQLRSAGTQVRLIAIEEDRDRYGALVENLAAFDAERGGGAPVAYLRHGTLAEYADEAFTLIGQSPAFVFLDPFGADGLSLDIVGRTLALSKGEVFALFSPRAIFRHLSALAADSHVVRAHRQIAEQPGMFPELDAAWLAEELERAAGSDASLLPTQQAAERILVDLFGGLDEVRRIRALPRGAWADEVLRAYVAALRACGATHILPIAIFDEEQQRAYYLIHAAKNRKATLKMKEAAHSAISKSELPHATKECIRLSHGVRIGQVIELVRRRFAGEAVRWTDDAKSLDTVQGFALSETLMMCDQAEQLKEELTRSYIIEKKPLRFGFPVIE